MTFIPYLLYLKVDVYDLISVLYATEEYKILQKIIAEN